VAGDRPALVSLLLYLLLAVAPTAAFWLAVQVIPAAVAAVARIRRNRAPVPVGRPLERLVADLRRLRGQMRGPPPTTMVRRNALVAAYDDVLLDVCAAVGIDAPLAGATDAERPFARLQTEAAVEAAGIVLDPRPGDGSAAA
jgi:hypothetical protein